MEEPLIKLIFVCTNKLQLLNWPLKQSILETTIVTMIYVFDEAKISLRTKHAKSNGLI